MPSSLAFIILGLWRKALRRHPAPPRQAKRQIPGRAVLACAALLAFAPPALAAGPSWPLTVTDSAGRSVTIPREPRAILLGSGFNLIALSLLLPDPVAPLVGWPDDLKRLSPELVAQFTARFPRLARLPVIGSNTSDGLSAEQALATGADLALFAGWQLTGPGGPALLARLEAAGIPVLVADFTSDEPLARTPATMRMLGRVLGREAQAEAFASFYESRLARIQARVAAAPGPRPGVLLNAYPATEGCCWVAGRTGVGTFIEAAGGQNIGAALLPGGASGTMHLEYLIAADPPVYIATGRAYAAGQAGLRLGPGVPEAEARRSLATVMQGRGLSGLSANRTGRVHAVWNFFNAVPLNILAVEAMARWIRPELFPDLDPAATLAEINERFAALPFSGSLWVSLEPERP